MTPNATAWPSSLCGREEGLTLEEGEAWDRERAHQNARKVHCPYSEWAPEAQRLGRQALHKDLHRVAPTQTIQNAGNRPAILARVTVITELHW